MSENPFIFTRPVMEENFYDRTVEIDIAIGFIRNLQNFSVIGERRMGKTSFLKHILSEEILEEAGIDPGRYIIVYPNMSSLHEKTKDTLIGALVKEIKDHVQIEVESENIYDELEACIKKLDSEGSKLIIVFDEFEIIAPILDYHFSYWLRSIFQGPNVLAITANRTTMREITSEGMASPLFNTFGNLFLGLFTRKETRNMVDEMFNRGGMTLDEKEISYLIDLSGGNPYLIQFLGFYYYEERRGKEGVVHLRFENRMLDYLKDQFENYLEHLEEDERNFLFYPENVDHPIGRRLRTKGFLIEENEELKISSKLLMRFLEIEKEKKEHKRKNGKIRFLFVKLLSFYATIIRFPFAKFMSLSALLITIIVSISMFVNFSKNKIPIVFTIISITFIIISVLVIPLYYLFLRRDLNE